jgi:hypothetical protein
MDLCGDLVSLADFDGLTPPTEIDFENAALWVRMFNLLLSCMSKEMGMRIRSYVVKVEEWLMMRVQIGGNTFRSEYFYI